MDTSAGARFEKTTVVPLYYTVWNAPFLTPLPSVRPPLDIFPAVTLENMEGILRIGNFDLWKEGVSSQDRKELASISICLVNRFESREHMGLLEQGSQDLLHRIFVCLRIVKPTRSPFYAVQFKRGTSGEVDVFSFFHPDRKELNVPGAETLNLINLDDIVLVRRILAPFLRVIDGGPGNLRRSIQLFDQGYAEVYDPVLQLVVWVMGIEAAFAKGDKPVTSDLLLQAIETQVGFDRNIYEDSGDPQFFEVPPPLTVGDTIHDLLNLRNHLVHGGWPEKDWAAKTGRHSISGETLPYADVLREAASFVLRKSILSFLTAPPQ
jgi:hypothetical protein